MTTRSESGAPGVLKNGGDSVSNHTQCTNESYTSKVENVPMMAVHSKFLDVSKCTKSKGYIQVSNQLREIK